MGDFVFYSVLVTQAGHSSPAAWAVCFVMVVSGSVIKWWVYEEVVADEINTQGTNSHYLPSG